MANPLHELSDLVHKLGEEIKNLADKMEHAFVKNAAPVETEVKADAEQVAQDAVKAAESTATQVVESN